MKFSKKILSILLAALMAISMMPFTASAASDDPYLTFTGTDSFSIKTGNSAKNWNGTLEYSTDKNTWTTWDGTEISSDNNVLYLRGTGNTQITGSNDNSRCWVITTPGTVACSGDIRTLLDYNDPEYSEMGTYCFAYLFYNCTSLTAAPELPATILAERCYFYMFYGCTGLTEAPELWATTLERYCYACMFYGCTSLTKAPELWAISLTEECYSNMFNGCTSLTKAPELPATELAPYCYNSMFQGCTSLTTPSELPAITLTKGCYRSMFEGCTGIKLSTEKTGEYSVSYSIPKEGTGSIGSNSLSNMFTGTGGTFTGTPAISTTYYIPAPAVTGVAEVNGTGYETLEEAIAAADDGDTITLLDDVTGNFTIPAGLDVSLDLNDHTITTSSSSTPVITNRGTLNVYGGTLVNNGLYFPGILGDGGVAVMNYGVATVNVTTNKGAIVNRSTANTTPNLTVAGGTYVGNPLALSSENNSYTAINGGNFTGGSSFVRANSGATTEVNDGNFACLGTESESNWIVNGGNVNAITVDGGSEDISINVNGGEIKSLPSTDTVNNSTNVSVEVSGGTFNSVVPEEYCAEGYTPVTEPNSQGKYEVKKAKEDGFNLTVEDKIYMNLYINVDDYTDPATATVTVTYNDPEKQAPTLKVDTYSGEELAALKDEEDGRYVIPVLAAPAQIRDNVSVTVTGRDDSITTSVAAYCEAIIAQSDNYFLVNLAKAMLDYGKACSAEFNYNVDGFASQDYYKTEEVSQYIETYGYLNSDNANGQFAGYAYIAKSVPALRIYLNTTEAEVVRNGLTARVNGVETEIKVVEGTSNVCVDITGILAENLNAEYTIEFNGGSIKLNALQYAKAMLANGKTVFARSMYNYSQAAIWYFD